MRLCPAGRNRQSLPRLWPAGLSAGPHKGHQFLVVQHHCIEQGSCPYIVHIVWDILAGTIDFIQLGHYAIVSHGCQGWALTSQRTGAASFEAHLFPFLSRNCFLFQGEFPGKSQNAQVRGLYGHSLCTTQCRGSGKFYTVPLAVSLHSFYMAAARLSR